MKEMGCLFSFKFEVVKKNVTGYFMIFCVYLTQNYVNVKAWSLCVAVISAFYSPSRQRTREP